MVAERAMNVRMDPKFFMMTDGNGLKRQARRSIWDERTKSIEHSFQLLAKSLLKIRFDLPLKK